VETDSVAYERILRLEIEALLDAVSTCPVPARAEALQRIVDEKCKLLEAIRPPLDDPNSQAPTEIVAEAPGASVEQVALMALAAVNAEPAIVALTPNEEALYAEIERLRSALGPADKADPPANCDNGANPCHGSYGTLNYA
jgi:hypothetical protein